jgi:hypothetical protein
MKFRICLVLVGVWTLTGCARTELYQSPELHAEGPKVVALQGDRLPWVAEIERRLRTDGFTVLRWEGREIVTESKTVDKTVQYREAETRYILRIDGSAQMDTMHRCMGGGYDFEYISAELIDAKTNQTISSFSGNGMSENCPPMSGHIYQQITSMVKSAWAK